MDKYLWTMNKEYFATPKRDGTPRKQQKNPWFTMRLDGGSSNSPLNGWSDKLAAWHENWSFNSL
jgi:hypothetical protein